MADEEQADRRAGEKPKRFHQRLIPVIQDV
jgi:hypothetical protein